MVLVSTCLKPVYHQTQHRRGLFFVFYSDVTSNTTLPLYCHRSTYFVCLSHCFFPSAGTISTEKRKHHNHKFLCLRVGKPMKKTFVSNASASMQQYAQQGKKHEYWFAVPKERSVALFNPSINPKKKIIYIIQCVPVDWLQQVSQLQTSYNQLQCSVHACVYPVRFIQCL